MKAIKTTYNDITYRSRLEAKYAVFFTLLGIEFEYEPEGYEFDNGQMYLPDFYLPRLKLFVEIKPRLPIPEWQLSKIISFAKGLPIILLVGNPSNMPFKMFSPDPFYKNYPDTRFQFYKEMGYWRLWVTNEG